MSLRAATPNLGASAAAAAPTVEAGALVLRITDARGRVVDLGRLAAGERGTAQTLAVMFALIQSARRSARVRYYADALARDAGNLFWWARENVEFAADPPGVELVRHPVQLLEQHRRTGRILCDCDDLAVLLGSLLAVGGRGSGVVLAVVGRDPSRVGQRWEHVLAGYLRDPLGPLVAANVYPVDPQETGAPGVWPLQRVRMLARADGEHV